MQDVAHNASASATEPGRTPAGIGRDFPDGPPSAAPDGSPDVRVGGKSKKRRGLRIGAFVGVAGLVAYGDFPFQGLTRSRLSAPRAYISELSVAGQPFGGVFRLSDLVAGIGFMVFAWTLGKWLRTPRARAACGLLILAGACGVVDAMRPMTSVSSIGQVTPGVDLSVLTAQLLQIHTLSGLVGFSSVLTAMGLLSMVLHQRANTRWLGPTGFVAVGAATTLGALEIGMDLAGVSWVGLAERIQVSIITVWLTAVAFAILHETRRPNPKPRLRLVAVGDDRARRSRANATPAVALLGSKGAPARVPRKAGDGAGVGIQQDVLVGAALGDRDRACQGIDDDTLGRGPDKHGMARGRCGLRRRGRWLSRRRSVSASGRAPAVLDEPTGDVWPRPTTAANTATSTVHTRVRGINS
jgi:hypothetical protein